VAADVLAVVPIDGPAISPAADVPCNALGLDHDHAAGSDQHVIDRAARHAERDVVDEPIVVREPAEQVRHQALVAAAVAHASQQTRDGPAEAHRDHDGGEAETQAQHGRMTESGAGVADDQGNADDPEPEHAEQRRPQPLLAAPSVTSADSHQTHVSSAASRPRGTRRR
jgi:hypothetical protein